MGDDNNRSCVLAVAWWIVIHLRACEQTSQVPDLAPSEFNRQAFNTSKYIADSVDGYIAKRWWSK